MLHVLSRLLGYWLTALALVAVVVDGAKSIAASSLMTTSLSDAWRAMGPAVEYSGIQPAAPASTGWAGGLDQVVPWLLTTPVAAAAGMLGVFFLVAGRKRRRYSLSREFAA